MSSFNFSECIWLVETIHRAGKITFHEINEKWTETVMSDGKPMPRPTFWRHKEAILEMFGIEIECDWKNGYCYYIANPDVFGEGSVRNWMFYALSLQNVLNDYAPLHSRILLENTPSGGETLRTVLEAMKESRRLEIHYRRYQSSVTKIHVGDPYIVKLFKRRWYMLLKMRADWFFVLALDRIVQISESGEKFVYDPQFDGEEYFRHCFGVVAGDNTEPERIVLRAYGAERFMMKDLPLHHSQREVGSTDTTVDFELFLKATDDFKAHLLSRAQWVRVISPEWLANDICTKHLEAIKRYSEKKTGTE